MSSSGPGFFVRLTSPRFNNDHYIGHVASGESFVASQSLERSFVNGGQRAMRKLLPLIKVADDKILAGCIP